MGLELAIYDLSPSVEGFTKEHNPNTKFSRNICSILDVAPSEIDIAKFKDGERDPNIRDSVRGKKIFAFQSYIEPIGERKYELELFLDAVGPGGGNKEGVVVVFPYCFGSRGERRTRPRQAAPTLVFAKSLGAFKGDTLLTGGVHADSIALVYNARDVYVEPLEFETVVANYIIRNYKDNKHVALMSPDDGGLKRVRRIEKVIKNPDVREMEGVTLDVITRSAEKIRVKGDEIDSLNLLGSVEGYDVIIVDDVADTLSTLYTAAKNCKDGGAKSIKALMYHATLGDGYETNMKKLFDEGLIDELILGNTVPIKDFAKNHPKVKVLPFEPLFAEAIKRIYENRSMSELYNYAGVIKIYNKARLLFKRDPKYVKIESINLPTLNS